VSAKSVRLFPNLLDCKAAFVEPPRRSGDLPPVQILLPDSTTVRSDSGEVDRVLSVYFKRNVTLGRAAPDDFTIDRYHPDVEGADPGGNRDMVVAQKLGAALFAELGMESPVPVGSFFDVFPLSVLTTSTLAQLDGVRPQSRFDQRRFRMNVIVETERPGLRRERLGRSRARVWWWGTAQGGATRSPLCDDDACSERSTPGYGCSSDTRWPQQGASRRSRPVPLRWGVRRGRCGGNSTDW